MSVGASATTTSAQALLDQIREQSMLRSFVAWTSLRRFVDNLKIDNLDTPTAIIIDIGYVGETSYGNLFVAPTSGYIMQGSDVHVIDDLPHFITLNKSSSQAYTFGDSLVIDPRPRVVNIKMPPPPVAAKGKRVRIQTPATPQKMEFIQWQFINVGHRPEPLSDQQKQILEAHGYAT